MHVRSGVALVSVSVCHPFSLTVETVLRLSVPALASSLNAVEVVACASVFTLPSCVCLITVLTIRFSALVYECTQPPYMMPKLPPIPDENASGSTATSQPSSRQSSRRLLRSASRKCVVVSVPASLGLFLCSKRLRLLMSEALVPVTLDLGLQALCLLPEALLNRLTRV